MRHARLTKQEERAQRIKAGQDRKTKKLEEFDLMSELQKVDPSGDDMGAQTLRQAAISESDPELKMFFWEEYLRYRKGL